LASENLRPLLSTEQIRRAAARHFGLDFIRIVTEDYFFVCKRAFLDTGPMQRILEIIRSADFRAAVATLPGYVPSNTGTVTGVKAFLEMHAVR
jgi:molybdate-binding protein